MLTAAVAMLLSSNTNQKLAFRVQQPNGCRYTVVVHKLFWGHAVSVVRHQPTSIDRIEAALKALIEDQRRHDEVKDGAKNGSGDALVLPVIGEAAARKLRVSDRMLNITMVRVVLDRATERGGRFTPGAVNRLIKRIGALRWPGDADSWILRAPVSSGIRGNAHMAVTIDEITATALGITSRLEFGQMRCRWLDSQSGFDGPPVARPLKSIGVVSFGKPNKTRARCGRIVTETADQPHRGRLVMC